MIKSIDNPYLARPEQITEFKKTVHQEIHKYETGQADTEYPDLINDLCSYLEAANQLENILIAGGKVEVSGCDLTIPYAILLSDIVKDLRFPPDENRQVFIGKEHCRMQGEVFNTLGGMALMVGVAETIPIPDRRSLEYCWDGIGDWQA